LNSTINIPCAGCGGLLYFNVLRKIFGVKRFHPGEEFLLQTQLQRVKDDKESGRYPALTGGSNTSASARLSLLNWQG
jgi:hypothetical protein